VLKLLKLKGIGLKYVRLPWIGTI